MESTAKVRHVRMGSIKMRQVANAIRGREVDQVLALLGSLASAKKAAYILDKAVRSAVANLQQANPAVGSSTSGLFIKAVTVDAGPIMKRMRPRSHGRADRTLKGSSHVTVVVGAKG